MAHRAVAHGPEDADMAEDHEVRIFAGRWSPAERTEILAELDRRDISVTVDGDDIVVPRHHQRETDMIVESVTEE